MKIQKFGGSNFISKDVFENFVNILENTDENSIIIVSALGKTTRRLLEAAKFAERSHFEDAISIINKLKSFIDNLISQIIQTEIEKTNCLEEVGNLFYKLEQYLKNISVVKELTPRILDSVLSFGERIALRVFKYFLLSKSVKFELLDAGEIIITDENYTNANPIHEIISNNINQKVTPLFEKSKFVLTQGFIGKTQKGDYSTMGFESSNLTALIFAENLFAKEITIWTDVEGIYNIDPHLTNKAAQIKTFSFNEAKIAAKYGNKLLYPKMIEAASNSNMNITYKSIHKPDGAFTQINSNFGQKNKMITFYDDIVTFTINLFNASQEEKFVMNLLTSNSDKVRYVSRFQNYAEVFTNDTDIVNFIQSNDFQYQNYSLFILINENILSLYKLIGEFSDLFINLDYKIFPIEDNTYLLFIKNHSNKDINSIINLLI